MRTPSKQWLGFLALLVCSVFVLDLHISRPTGVTAENYSRIQMGMTAAEVQALLGEKGEEVLTGPPFDPADTTERAWLGHDRRFIAVRFDRQGRVVSTQWGHFAVPEQEHLFDRWRRWLNDYFVNRKR